MSCAQLRDDNTDDAISTPLSATEPEVDETDPDCSYFYFLWGRYAELTDHLDEALEAYEKALICDQSADYIARKIPILLLRLNRIDDAKAYLEEYLRKHPMESGVRLLLAKIHIRQKSYDQAIEQYRIIHQQQPEEVQSLLLLSELYLGRQQFDSAREVLQQVVDIEPQNYPAQVLLARIYLQEKEVDKALHHYSKALAINSSSELEMEIAEVYLQNKRYTEAEKIYKRIVNRDPEDEEAGLALVHVYLLQKKEAQALTTLNRLKIISENPDRLEITIAKIYARQKQFTKAENILKGILVRENHSQARYLLAIIYLQKEDYEAALRQLQQIPSDDEEYQDSVFLQVRLLRTLNRSAEAIDLLEKAIKDQNIQEVDTYILLATLYQLEGKKSLGEETFSRALSIYPDDDNLLYEYGLFLDQTGQRQRAMSVMQQVIERQPEHAAALNYVGYTWADRKEHLDKALEYIKRAVELKPENGYIRDSLGWVYFRLGNLEMAQQELEKAVSLSPDDPAILEHLGDVYLEADRLENALQTYRKAFEHYTEEPDQKRVQEKITILEGKVSR